MQADKDRASFSHPHRALATQLGVTSNSEWQLWEVNGELSCHFFRCCLQLLRLPKVTRRQPDALPACWQGCLLWAPREAPTSLGQLQHRAGLYQEIQNNHSLTCLTDSSSAGHYLNPGECFLPWNSNGVYTVSGTPHLPFLHLEHQGIPKCLQGISLQSCSLWTPVYFFHFYLLFNF